MPLVRTAATLIAAILLALLPLGRASAAGEKSELVSGRDPRAKPIRDAIRGLMEPLAAGDNATAALHFAGRNADLELLRAYEKAIDAERRAAVLMDKQFGPDPQRLPGRITWGVGAWGKSFDHNSVTFWGNEASCSAGGPLGEGIELIRVNSVWKVRSLASPPQTPEQHLKRLAAYTPKVEAVAAGVRKGTIGSADEAMKALGEAAGSLYPKEPAADEKSADEKSPATRGG